MMTKTRLFFCAIAGFALAIPVAALANPADDQYGNPVTQAGPPTTSTIIATTTNLAVPAAASTATTTTTATTTQATTTAPTTTTTTTTSTTTPSKSGGQAPSKSGSGPPSGPPALSTPSSGTLPFTGQNLAFAAVAGLLLLTLGFGLRRFGRKRTG